MKKSLKTILISATTLVLVLAFSKQATSGCKRPKKSKPNYESASNVIGRFIFETCITDTLKISFFEDKITIITESAEDTSYPFGNNPECIALLQEHAKTSLQGIIMVPVFISIYSAQEQEIPMELHTGVTNEKLNK